MRIVDKQAIIAICVLMLAVIVLVVAVGGLVFGSGGPDIEGGLGALTDSIDRFFDELFDDPQPTPPPAVVATPPPAVVDGDAHPLVGTWSWSGDRRWQYVFHADGTGTRGTGALAIEWSISEEGLLVIHPSGGNEERWNYVIDGDVVTLSSTYFPGVVYRTGDWNAPGNQFTYNRR